MASKEHCMYIKEKQNISSQSFLRSPSTLKLSFQFVWLQSVFKTMSICASETSEFVVKRTPIQRTRDSTRHLLLPAGLFQRNKLKSSQPLKVKNMFEEELLKFRVHWYKLCFGHQKYWLQDHQRPFCNGKRSNAS